MNHESAGEKTSNACARFLKMVWLALWAAAATLLLFLPAIVASRLPPTRALGNSICRLWAGILLAVTGVRARAQGLEKIRAGQSYIIVANHQSYFDVLALLVTLPLPVRWIVKKELRKIPVFGFSLQAMHNVFIDRSDSRQAVRSIQEGLERVPRGTSFLFFAEGTRSADGRIGPFKKGGFRTAQQAGLPVLPVVIRGSRRIMPKGDWVFRPGTIEVVILDPVQVDPALPEKAFSDLIETTRERMIGVFEGRLPDRHKERGADRGP